jgi:hypothetical protein
MARLLDTDCSGMAEVYFVRDKFNDGLDTDDKNSTDTGCFWGFFDEDYIIMPRYSRRKIRKPRPHPKTTAVYSAPPGTILQESFPALTSGANDDVGWPAAGPCTSFAIYTLLHYPAREISIKLPLVGELDTTSALFKQFNYGSDAFQERG